MTLNTNFTPFPELLTERFLLRRTTIDDAQEFYQLRSDDRTMQYLDRNKAKDVEEVIQLITSIDSDIDAGNGIMWSIVPKGGQKIIGTIGFWRMKKEHFRSEIGYLLHPDYWRQGVMSEALHAVLRFGFEVMLLHSVEAITNPNNIPSRKLLEKAGFALEGHFREDFYFNGRFMDSTVYGLLGREYKL
jgi:ribosomal-protein-alanine N-acetyltransferase